MVLERIETKLNQILAIHNALPTWFPLTQQYAEECGYKTIAGLRKWCYKNLNPDIFQKKGKNCFIHISVLHIVKRKAV